MDALAIRERERIDEHIAKSEEGHSVLGRIFLEPLWSGDLNGVAFHTDGKTLWITGIWDSGCAAETGQIALDQFLESLGVTKYALRESG